MEHRDMEYVGFWPRVGATIIDAILIMLITWPATYFVYGWAYFESDKLIQGPADVLINWLAPAVIVILFWVARGQTPGKMAIGAVIVDADTGNPITAGKAIIRYLGYFISLIGLFIGYIWVGFDPKKQGWHDHIANQEAGTLVEADDRALRVVRQGVEL
jgi:uncharacterized RDD family membrane protein YckC